MADPALLAHGNAVLPRTWPVRLTQWFSEGDHEPPGSQARPMHTTDWWKVMGHAYLLKFLTFGEGDTAPVTRAVLRQFEADPRRRPRVHVG